MVRRVYLKDLPLNKNIEESKGVLTLRKFTCLGAIFIFNLKANILLLIILNVFYPLVDFLRWTWFLVKE